MISYNDIHTVYIYSYSICIFPFPDLFLHAIIYGHPSVQGSDEGGPLLTIAVGGSYRPTYLEATETGSVDAVYPPIP